MVRVLAFVIAMIVFVFSLAALMSQGTINSGDRFPWSMSMKQNMPTVSSGDRFMVRSMPMKQRMPTDAHEAGDMLKNFKKGDGLWNLKIFLTYGYLQRLCQPHTPPTTLLDDKQCNSSLSVTGILDRARLDTLRIQPWKLMATRNKKELNRVNPISCGVFMNQRKDDQLLSIMSSQFDALRNFKNKDTPNRLEDLKIYLPRLSQHSRYPQPCSTTHSRQPSDVTRVIPIFLSPEFWTEPPWTLCGSNKRSSWTQSRPLPTEENITSLEKL